MERYSGFAIALGLAFLLCIGGCGDDDVTGGKGQDPGAGWTMVTVDSAPQAGENSSLALDGNDRVHISYRDDTKNTLKYASNASGQWLVTTVDSSVTVGDNPTSIAVDSQGNAHVAYGENTNVDLRYATDASGQWVVSTVDSEGSVGDHASIAVDSQDNIYIVYEDDSASDLNCASNAGGGWTIEKIRDAPFPHTDLAVDSNDALHVAFSDWYVYHATNASGLWTSVLVDSSGMEHAYDVSIAVDEDGNVRMCYEVFLDRDWTLAALRYATNETGQWVTTTIDDDGKVGQCCSIAVGPDGKVHVAYLDRRRNDLKYATNASGSWKTATIDETGGWYCSLGLDSDGGVHISYHAAGHLMYAVKR